ncbi:TIGR02597 family protein [Puniceicoccus vermicola]|nr:TIGR02597 family protein [Puniceicoccus vermicola]
MGSIRKNIDKKKWRWCFFVGEKVISGMIFENEAYLNCGASCWHPTLWRKRFRCKRPVETSSERISRSLEISSLPKPIRLTIVGQSNKLPMSSTKFLSFVAGAAAFLSFNLNAAETDPVGAISLTFKANSDTAFSVPLHRSAEFSGVIADAGVDGFTLSADGTPGWSTGQFVDAPYYVLMMDGPMEGMYYTVLGNSTGEVTVEDIGAGDLAGQGIAAGQKFQVIPYWTLNSLFPDGEGIPASSNVGSPQGLVLFTNQNSAGTNIPLGLSYLYHDGSQGPEGWYLNGNIAEGLQNDVAFTPDSFYVVRNLTPSDEQFNLVGAVRMADHKTILSRIQTGLRQDNFVGFTFPVPTTLAESGLQSSPAFEASSDVGNPADVLLVYNNSSVGFNKPPSLGYLYHDGSQGPAGWYILGDIAAGVQNDTEVFIPGNGYIVRKNVGESGSNIWSADPSYDSN